MTVALHHEIAGPAGAPVVLLGGSLGTDLRMWDGQLPLAERFRLVRFDHRGHGGSPVPPGRYTIVAYCGLSIGGMVGMWLGANAPERLDHLVLLCTAAWMPAAAAYAERATAVRGAGSVAPVADAVLERWLTPPFAAGHPNVAARLREMLVATSPEGYAGCCEAIAAMDLRAALPDVAVPTLVISGADDPATPVELQRQIAAAIPGARHAIVRPAAHLAAVEQAGQVNELIGGFLT